MLTATYSLVAITAEQDKTRSLLQRLQQFIQASWKGLQGIDFGFLESGYQRLLHFDQYLKNRKIELYLVPALRGVSREADQVLAEFDALGEKARDALHHAGRQLTMQLEHGRSMMSQFCDSMHTYCVHIAARMNLEERALLPIAKRIFSVDDWFRLAAHFLEQADTGRHFARRLPGARAAPRTTAGRDMHQG
jgi:hypothetical protein